MLGVDFGDGRREAGFPELVANIAVDCTFYESVVLPHQNRSAEPDFDTLVRRWCDNIVDRGSAVDAVVGFCAGATLACALADTAAERTGKRPLVILLDPLVVRPEMLLHRFQESVDSFASLVDQEVVKHAMTTAHAAVDRVMAVPGTAECGALVGTLQAAQRTVVESACATADIDTDLASQLTEHFACLVDYLALAMSLDPGSLWAPTVTRPTAVLVSRDYRHEPPLPPASHVFDVSRVDFLDDADVAATVSSLIKSAAMRPREHQS